MGDGTQPRGSLAWVVDGPELSDGQWYADLRIEASIEKNALVGLPVIRGFGSEQAADAFGRHLGYVRSRPALANHLVETVTGTLRDHRSASSRGTKNRLKREVVEVRLDIQDGTRMQPRAVRLVVLHDGAPGPDTREWFGE